MSYSPTVAVALITYNRSARLVKLIPEIIRTAQYPIKIYVCTEDSDVETIQIVSYDFPDVSIILNTGRTAVSAQNLSYLKTTEDILCMCGDDIEYVDGWLRKAIEAFEANPSCMVIANEAFTDNSRSCSAGCGTFIIKREYIQKQSGCIDTPDVIYFPGYKHTFSDEEFWKTALFRKVGLMLNGAWVIHHHWNLSPRFPHDSTYSRQEAWGAEDCETFQKRRNMFRG